MELLMRVLCALFGHVLPQNRWQDVPIEHHVGFRPAAVFFMQRNPEGMIVVRLRRCSRCDAITDVSAVHHGPGIGIS